MERYEPSFRNDNLLKAEIELREISERVEYMMRRPRTSKEEFERLNAILNQMRLRLRSMYEARRRPDQGPDRLSATG